MWGGAKQRRLGRLAGRVRPGERAGQSAFGLTCTPCSGSLVIVTVRADGTVVLPAGLAVAGLVTVALLAVIGVPESICGA